MGSIGRRWAFLLDEIENCLNIYCLTKDNTLLLLNVLIRSILTNTYYKIMEGKVIMNQRHKHYSMDLINFKIMNNKAC